MLMLDILKDIHPLPVGKFLIERDKVNSLGAENLQGCLGCICDLNIEKWAENDSKSITRSRLIVDNKYRWFCLLWD